MLRMSNSVFQRKPYNSAMSSREYASESVSVVTTSISRVAARLVNREANHPHLERLRDPVIHRRIHPGGAIWSDPRHQAVMVTHPPALAQITAAALVQPRAHMNAVAPQHGEHHERTEVAIHHGHVARLERVEHRPQQGRLTSLLALIGSAGQIRERTGRQRYDRRRPGDRQADAGLLGFCLRILRLICRGVGHGEREAVNELCVMRALPEPARLSGLLQLLGYFAADRFQRLWRKLGPGTTIVAGVFRWRSLAPLETRGNDAGDGRLAGRLLPIAKNLRQPRPEHDGRRIDPVLSEQAALRAADPLNPFGGKNLAEGESLTGQKDIDNPTKTAADSCGRSGYFHGHEKTRLGFSLGSEPRRASSYRQGQGMTARSALDCGILKNPLRQPKANLRAHFGTTVPFVAGTLCLAPRRQWGKSLPP